MSTHHIYYIIYYANIRDVDGRQYEGRYEKMKLSTKNKNKTVYRWILMVQL